MYDESVRPSLAIRRTLGSNGRVEVQPEPVGPCLSMHHTAPRSCAAKPSAGVHCTLAHESKQVLQKWCCPEGHGQPAVVHTSLQTSQRLDSSCAIARDATRSLLHVLPCQTRVRLTLSAGQIKV